MIVLGNDHGVSADQLSLGIGGCKSEDVLLTGAPTERLGGRASAQVADVKHLAHGVGEGLPRRLSGDGRELVKLLPVELTQKVSDLTGSWQSAPRFRGAASGRWLSVPVTSNNGALLEYFGGLDIGQKLGENITARKNRLVGFSDHGEQMLLVVARDAVAEKLKGCGVDGCFDGVSDRRCAPQPPPGKCLEDSPAGDPGVGNLERGPHGQNLSEDGQEWPGILVGGQNGEVALCDVAVIGDVERAGPLVGGA